METAEILPENEVTTENLATLFKRAFFSISFDKDGDLVVQTDGPKVFVIVDENKKMLKYMTIYGVKETSPLELKHALANRMNDSIILG